MFQYAPKVFPPKWALDFAFGIENLTKHMLKVFPEVEINALDISEEILKESRKSLSNTPTIISRPNFKA